MEQFRIAIDGASKGNGTLECCAAAAIYVIGFVDGEEVVSTIKTSCEAEASSNQRAEILGLIEALKFLVVNECDEAQIITDSAYVFNAATQRWFDRWEHNGWHTANGDPVANKDLWRLVMNIIGTVKCEVSYYHVKGHVLSIGAVTASNLVKQDKSGHALYKYAQQKYDQDETKPVMAKRITHALEVSDEINGPGLFSVCPELLRTFCCMNSVVDNFAKHAVEEMSRKK